MTKQSQEHPILWLIFLIRELFLITLEHDGFESSNDLEVSYQKNDDGQVTGADVLVYDRNARPLMVVECKRPEVALTEEVLDQAIRYNIVLDVKFMIITNGTRTFICRRQGEGFVFIDTVPTYTEMLCHQQ